MPCRSRGSPPPPLPMLYRRSVTGERTPRHSFRGLSIVTGRRKPPRALRPLRPSLLLYPPSPKLAKTGHSLLTYLGFLRGFLGTGFLRSCGGMPSQHGTTWRTMPPWRHRQVHSRRVEARRLLAAPGRVATASQNTQSFASRQPAGCNITAYEGTLRHSGRDAVRDGGDVGPAPASGRVH